MRSVRKIVGRLLRGCAIAAWCGFGVWVALATYFAAPIPRPLASSIAVAIAVVFFVSARERFRLHQWFATPWPRKRLTTVALGTSAIVLVGYFGLMAPDPNQDWEPEHARVPAVTIDGDKIRVANARNFTWISAEDETPGYYDRVYDLNAITSMNYVLCPLRRWDGVAHVFVTFNFSDGQHVAVSIEGRRVRGRPYRVFPSLFRQYQLLYVVGDERDVVGLRGAIWRVPVYFYPARTSPERTREIFLDMMRRADSLEAEPEYYNLITNNCLNNITGHLRRLGGSPPNNLRLLLTGYSDRLAYRLNFLDTDLPFEKARTAFRIDQWMQTTPLDETFSKRLRENLIRQVSDAGGRTDMIR